MRYTLLRVMIKMMNVSIWRVLLFDTQSYVMSLCLSPTREGCIPSCHRPARDPHVIPSYVSSNGEGPRVLYLQ